MTDLALIATELFHEKQWKKKQLIGVKIRPIKRSDFQQLVEWINAPHVARFWEGLVDINSVEEKYGSRLDDNAKTRVYVVEVGGQPIGMIQCYRHIDFPEWDQTINIERAAGIDYLIGDERYIGRGIGPEMIREIVQTSFNTYSDVDVIVSAPQKDNSASCRALEKAGFTLKEERKLDSACISDSGISCIYTFQRP